MANKYFELALTLEGDSYYRAIICYAISKSDFKHYDEAIQLYHKAIETKPEEVKGDFQ